MKNTAIIISNLTKEYYLKDSIRKSLLNSIKQIFVPSKTNDLKKITAIDNLSLKIDKGETVGILGRNSAGKSTLLKILSQITKPTAGTISIDGSIASVIEIGTGFIPQLSGRENIYLYGELVDISRAKLKHLEQDIIEFSQLNTMIDMPIKYYSSGMRMRLAFSIVSHIDKDILLFDEALSVGDIYFKNKCQKQLFELKKQKKTLIIVSHNINEINNLCDRLILIDNGKIISDGTTNEIIMKYDKYIHIISPRYMLRQKTIEQNILDNKNFLKTKHVFKNQISSYAISLISCTINNGNNVVFKLFSPLDIQIQIKGNFTTIDNYQIGFVVQDLLHNNLFYQLSDKLDLQNAENKTLTWTIKNNRLSVGVYKVGFFLSINSRFFNNQLDVLSFEIIDKDNILKNKLYTPFIPEVEYKQE